MPKQKKNATRAINVYFRDEDYIKLKELKDKLKVSWRDFILKLLERFIENEEV